MGTRSMQLSCSHWPCAQSDLCSHDSGKNLSPVDQEKNRNISWAVTSMFNILPNQMLRSVSLKETPLIHIIRLQPNHIYQEVGVFIYFKF